ncbi:MAG TPA: apolipoprotein N-acyltransferase [Actinomycetota bacterium]|nr:apolipoprotein N-acyltransferase [Actinomycetota bacterium]
MPRVSFAATASEKAAQLASLPAGLLAGAISGGLLFLAFPPADLWFLAPVALIPLALHFAVGRMGSVAAAGVAFGLVFNGLLLYWIRLFGPAPYVALTIVQTLWIVVALVVGVLVRDRIPAKVRFLALPLVFLLQEFARSRIPWEGFGWGGLGYTQHDNRLALRLAAYTGVWGLSFLVGLANSLLAESILSYRSRHQFGLVATALAGMALFPAVLPVPTPDGPAVKVAMIQGNVPEDTLDPNADDDIVVANHVRLTEEVAGTNPDLVVWPEGAFDRDPLLRSDYRQTLVESVRRTDAHFLVGAILGTGVQGDLRNSSLLLDPQGEVQDIYTKQRLVPFGEWVPLRSFLQPLVPDVGRIPFDQNPGKESTVFELPQGSFAALICYESTYPDLVRTFVREGARMLVVSANFSSFDHSAASAQHIAFTQMRAAEQRMWVAHASISGISAVVDPAGRVLQQTGLFEPATLVPTLPMATTTTPYARLGDWVPAAAALTVAAALLAPAFRIGRRREAAGTAAA